jgi:hypothetical protein
MQQAKRKDYPEKLVSTKYNETNSERKRQVRVPWNVSPPLAFKKPPAGSQLC